MSSLFDVYPLQPIEISHAKGSYLWDKMQTRYVDMYGGHAVISIGHNHPHWVKRIEDQLQKISFYSNSVIISIQEELASLLVTVSKKNDYQLFLINSGAEANENAIKLASFHTKRKKLVCFSKAFHGRTSLAVAATDNPSIVALINETDDIIRLPFNDIEALKYCFDKQGKEIAAVIIEPIQGVGGIQVADILFLQTIRTLCTQAGAIFISDEVQCGYGRTGMFFALDHAHVQADIYTMAKGMGNGFPIGGVLIAPFIKPSYGLLGTTFGGNPLACAAALAVLEIIEKEHVLLHTQKMGSDLMATLSGMFPALPIRGKGLMIGIDMPSTWGDIRKILLYTYHIFTGEAKPNTMRLLPALNVERAHIDEFIHGITQATKAYC